MKIKTFNFNPFGVNTFMIYDDTSECVIIDAACHEELEVQQILDFISNNKLNPRFLLNTHGHVDHICGNNYILQHFNIPLLMHEEDVFLVDSAIEHGKMFGFYISQPPLPTGFIKEGKDINFGESSLEIFHTPGHSPGSVIFYSAIGHFLISGDVIFSESIGRTDLPGGNFEELINSIKSKILVLPDKNIIYPGHGNFTTIGIERETNPFLQ